MGSFNREFGQFVQSKRDAAGLSQEELANRVGLTRVSIANIESGKHGVQLETAIELAVQLNFSLDEVRLLTDQTKIQEKLEDVSEEFRNAIMKITRKENSSEG